jgi:crotonobetainyl-CoA:carnitine CoA-transferase CaiB-like acyl-CoA transferase
MPDGLQSAIQRFPEKRAAIEAMCARDDEFRTLCDDLAEAEAALSRWEGSTAPYRDQRCAEYRELVASLAAELESALQAAAVVPFRPSRRHPPPYRS